MRWKQFFTPVKSIDAIQARDIITGKSPADLTILDVRQPGEYESGHIPGAKLIPMPELGARIGEIEQAKPTIVY